MKKVMLMLMLLLSLVVLSACAPSSPLSYQGTTWACEDPYMRFTVSRDEIGATGIGDLQTADGDTIAVRFVFERGACYICRESDCFGVDVDGEIYPEFQTELSIIDGDYKMRRHNTIAKVTIWDDEIYNGKYKKLTFERQD